MGCSHSRTAPDFCPEERDPLSHLPCRLPKPCMEMQQHNGKGVAPGRAATQPPVIHIYLLGRGSHPVPQPRSVSGCCSWRRIRKARSSSLQNMHHRGGNGYKTPGWRQTGREAGCSCSSHSTAFALFQITTPGQLFAVILACLPLCKLVNMLRLVYPQHSVCLEELKSAVY